MKIEPGVVSEVPKNIDSLIAYLKSFNIDLFRLKSLINLFDILLPSAGQRIKNRTSCRQLNFGVLIYSRLRRRLSTPDPQTHVNIFKSIIDCRLIYTLYETYKY